MADRPAQICQLEKGKLVDTQQGFVDTFNWVAQSMANLDGGENCEVSWALPDHPTIDVTQQETDGGGGSAAAVYDVYAGDDEGKDGLWVTYTDQREDQFIPLSGGGAIEISADVDQTTGQQTSFKLESKYDSNITFTINGNTIQIGAYYI